MRNVYNQFSAICRYPSRLIICGVLMKNIILENDSIAFYLNQIDNTCEEISLALYSGDTQAIENCVNHIQHTNYQIYCELECKEIHEDTVVLSVVKDFFDEHHIADNLSMGDVMELKKTLRGWYESIR